MHTGSYREREGECSTTREQVGDALGAVSGIPDEVLQKPLAFNGRLEKRTGRQIDLYIPELDCSLRNLDHRFTVYRHARDMIALSPARKLGSAARSDGAFQTEVDVNSGDAFGERNACFLAVSHKAADKLAQRGSHTEKFGR